MTAHIVVEGPTDKKILSLLLDDLSSKHSFEIVVAGGRNAGRPIARKYLLRSAEPTAFVFDTETADPASVREQVRSLEDYFSWGNQGTPFKVVPMAPMLEVLFFEHPKAILRRLNSPLHESLLRAGHFAPKQMLTEILGQDQSALREFIQELTPEEVSDMRKDRAIDDLREFISAHA